MLYTYVKQNYNFTDEDRQEAYKMLQEILRFSEKTRNGGLLTLKDEIPDCKNPFLKKAVEFIVEGDLNEKEISEIFDNYIIFGDYTSKEMLELIIIKEGCLLIIHGCNPSFISKKLTPILGKDFK